jgi:hypothetical protein
MHCMLLSHATFAFSIKTINIIFYKVKVKLSMCLIDYAPYHEAS